MGSHPSSKSILRELRWATVIAAIVALAAPLTFATGPIHTVGRTDDAALHQGYDPKDVFV